MSGGVPGGAIRGAGCKQGKAGRQMRIKEMRGMGRVRKEGFVNNKYPRARSNTPFGPSIDLKPLCRFAPCKVNILFPCYFLSPFFPVLYLQELKRFNPFCLGCHGPNGTTRF